MKVVAFVPIKMNNERVPGKNTKRMYDGTPLIHFMLKSLLGANEINEIYVYCSSDEIKEYLFPGITFKRRDPKYDTADADVNDMFYAFSQEVVADIYVLAHVTAPFLKSESIDCAVRKVLEGEYDSAMAVKKMQEFIWKDGKPLNYDTKNIPRTQDLVPYYIETTGLYVYNRAVIQNNRSRIGNRPYLQEVSDMEAIDINHPVDFEIANAVYEKIIKNM